MEVRGKVDRVARGLNGDIFLTLEVYDKNTLIREIGPLQKEEILDIRVKKTKVKRSLNANNYLWYLINQISNKVNISNEEVYIKMLKDYGQVALISIKKEVNVDNFFKYYEEAGTSVLNDCLYKHYKVYKGSSEFSKEEMNILLNGVVEECKNLDIPTKTDIEIQTIIKEWENR